jgi:monofunctional biosynthetic peptidoglycan transglycosylase
MKNVRKHYIPTTAKNVFLWQGRSYIRKGLETYFTVLIEIIWGKEHHGGLFEQYRNGNGVYGAQAAAEHWYRKEASGLTPKQAWNCSHFAQS